ncbi:23S rRNA pseudouridine1911/1915/1917 synthase [Butyrivibrio hungatei]|uniref:Pseudouridine synthase n=1 Tax=Butyrivibrio hungatei TaxID=185008 RepID=A0A1G5B9S4_9FIRM|nr:RluA family pseudouridine synthase [Butyrivibrio hungatei]SCX86924.1 23S rRNA pseudouridine1911/1915/1917 synthase [Butyrivibrio hungatei]
MNKEYREIEYTVKEADGRLTAGEIMRERLMLSSREVSRCKQFDDGVMCKGMPIRIISVLEPGEVLTVRLYEDIENGSLIIPSDEPIDIVYEDEDLILLNKKGDMVVHPSYAHYKDSLSNALAGFYKKTGQEHVMRVIGRLDRETSGLIIFAKNRHSASILSRKSERMSRRKEYLALCSGIFETKEGTVDAPIERIPGQRMIREVRDDGKRAITHYKVEKEFQEFSLVRLKLDTGRTHQIRVHMSYIGHPLLGDNLYGKEIEDNKGLTRAALHACHLEFEQPITGEKLSFEAQLPEDMQNAIGD